MSRHPHGISRIVSGGQSGVDRAALDVAIKLGIEHGGWCPKGRIAEDGPIAAQYALREMPTADYAARTEQNVLDSDGTLILYYRRLQGGTLLTQRLAKSHHKPLFRVRLDLDIKLAAIVGWIHDHRVKVLNVAGPRASSHSDIQQLAYDALLKLFQSTSQLPFASKNGF